MFTRHRGEVVSAEPFREREPAADKQYNTLKKATLRKSCSFRFANGFYSLCSVQFSNDVYSLFSVLFSNGFYSLFSFQLVNDFYSLFSVHSPTTSFLNSPFYTPATSRVDEIAKQTNNISEHCRLWAARTFLDEHRLRMRTLFMVVLEIVFEGVFCKMNHAHRQHPHTTPPHDRIRLPKRSIRIKCRCASEVDLHLRWE